MRKELVRIEQLVSWSFKYGFYINLICVDSVLTLITKHRLYNCEGTIFGENDDDDDEMVVILPSPQDSTDYRGIHCGG